MQHTASMARPNPFPAIQCINGNKFTIRTRVLGMDCKALIFKKIQVVAERSPPRRIPLRVVPPHNVAARSEWRPNRAIWALRAAAAPLQERAGHSTVTLLARLLGLCRHITSLREVSGVQTAPFGRCAQRLRRSKSAPVIRPSRSWQGFWACAAT